MEIYVYDENTVYDEACLGSLALKGQTPSIASVSAPRLIVRPAGAWGRLKLPVWSANPPYNRTLFMVNYAYDMDLMSKVSFEKVAEVSQQKWPKCLH